MTMSGTRTGRLMMLQPPAYRFRASPGGKGRAGGRLARSPGFRVAPRIVEVGGRYKGAFSNARKYPARPGARYRPGPSPRRPGGPAPSRHLPPIRKYHARRATGTPLATPPAGPRRVFSRVISDQGYMCGTCAECRLAARLTFHRPPHHLCAARIWVQAGRVRPSPPAEDM